MGKNKGFIEGILHDILLAGIVEASRDNSGKSDPYKAAGIAYGLGHLSMEDQARLATMLGADGAFDNNENVNTFPRRVGNHSAYEYHRDWREDILLENEYGIDPYDFDTEEDYLEAVEDAENRISILELTSETNDTISIIPLIIDAEENDIDSKEKVVKSYLYKKYSNAYPKLFAPNYTEQTFYDIGYRAAKSPTTVEIPFNFLLDVCSQFEVSGINIFNLLTGGTSKKYLDACNKFAKDLNKTIEQCILADDDYESLLNFIYSKYMLSQCSLDIVCEYIATIIIKIESGNENAFLVDFFNESLDLISDGLSSASFEEKLKFLKLCKSSAKDVESSKKYKNALSRINIENEMQQLFCRFFSSKKKISFDFDDEKESIDMLVFSMISGKDKKVVYPLFSELLIDPTLTPNQKRWIQIGFEYLALYAAEGRSEDEMYDYFIADDNFRNALMNVKYIGRVLGNMLVLSIQKNDMATYRDIIEMYNQHLLHDKSQYSNFIKQVNESIECVYIDPFCNTAEKFAEYIEFRNGLLNIIQQRNTNISCVNIKRFCKDIEASYDEYKKKLEKISLAEAKQKEIMTKISRVCKLIEQGIYWHNTKSKFRIKYTFKYPNGKHGDINKYLASKCGQITQIDPLHFYVEITEENREFLPLLSAEYENDNSQNMGIIRYLSKEHYFFILKQLLIEIENLQNESPHEIKTQLELSAHFWDEIREVECDFYKTIQEQRNQIYQSLAQSGLLTSKWVSEYQVFKIVSSVYPDAIYQYRAEWLGNQSLDVFIPSINTGIEYQGIQHYQAVDIFGGEEGLIERRKLDAKKKRLCRTQGIRLIEIKYTESISVDSITEKLNNKI